MKFSSKNNKTPNTLQITFRKQPTRKPFNAFEAIFELHFLAFASSVA